MSRGHVSLILHAHLPFVRHPEHDFHLEETWFFEAMHETYLPLIEVGRRLERDDVPGTLTISLSPPLMAMMEDELLVSRFCRHLEHLVSLAERETSRRRTGSDRHRLAQFYLDRFRRQRELFVETLDRDVIGAFAELERAGRFELMTCAGTHGLLPLMRTEASRRAHVRAARRAFERRFDHAPRGMWLPECAYEPGLDARLAEEKVDFSILESHGIERASSAPVRGNASPLISEHGVAFFGRDTRASTQVWNADTGYPGDPHYREFYRDLGWELDVDQLAPLPIPKDDRYDTGLKYHRVTGDVALDDKALYDPDRAAERIETHARDFVRERLQHVQSLSADVEPALPHLTCPYDAELFGHWWFEGPRFLEAVFREAADVEELTLTSPLDHLESTNPFQQAEPATSTWGKGGGFAVWLDETNAWLYRHLHNAERAVVDRADALVAEDGRREGEQYRERALEQAARELMMAQASDWAFILYHETSTEYALDRTREHLGAVHDLLEATEADDVESGCLESREERHPLFPDLKTEDWSPT
jgi:1,4-alpha-glucan branching enzyme